MNIEAPPPFAVERFKPKAPAAADLASPLPLKASRFVWRDPSTIPPRRFLYGRHSIRGFISVTAAIGGLGKTSLLLAESIALGTGRALLGVTPWERSPVWYMGLEDPLDEYERRVAAIALHYRIPSDEIEAALFLDSGRDQDFVIATEERSGTKIIEPVVTSIIDNVRQHGICQIVVDPFVACHAVSENDNSRLEKVTRAWARIANETNCAVELVHHFRKSGNVEPTTDDVRGASSIVGAARSVRILAGMSQDQADQAGVKDRFRYFNASFGKANLFPRSETADWFNLTSIGLGNGGGRPDDEIGVTTAWKWPDALDSVTVADLRAVQSRVAEGRWRENAQAKDWVGNAVADVLRLDVSKKPDRAKINRLLKTWIRNKMFVVVEGEDERREKRSFVEVGDWATD